MDVFKQAKQKLAQVRLARGEKISLNLKFKRDKQLATEQAIVENLRRLTEDWQPTDASRRLAGDWPPVLPVSRMVERFTAMAVGLHSENPRVPFAENVGVAFQQAVAPALAWGLMIRLYELPEELRAATQTKLVERLLDERAPALTEVNLGGEGYRKVRFPTLRLVEAWYQLFASASPCPLDPAQIRTLRAGLADRFRRPLSELDTQLWQELGGLYISTLAGSERARAVSANAWCSSRPRWVRRSRTSVCARNNGWMRQRGRPSPAKRPTRPTGRRPGSRPAARPSGWPARASPSMASRMKTRPPPGRSCCCCVPP
jgi:hypothetical protein